MLKLGVYSECGKYIIKSGHYVEAPEFVFEKIIASRGVKPEG